MVNGVEKARKFYGLSLQDLADKCGAGKTTISDIEQGRHIPNVYLAIRIAKALHTTVEKIWEVESEDGQK